MMFPAHRSTASSPFLLPHYNNSDMAGNFRSHSRTRTETASRTCLFSKLSHFFLDTPVPESQQIISLSNLLCIIAQGEQNANTG